MPRRPPRALISRKSASAAQRDHADMAHELLPAPQPDARDVPLKTALAHMANGISPAAVGMAQFDWLAHLAVSPARQADLQASAWRKWVSWLQHASQSWSGECAPCIEPVASDRRFSDPAWQQPPFSGLAQGFLLAQQWWEEAGSGVRGVSRHHQDVAAFTARQWLDMLSPSNWPLLNPQVLRATATTGGLNLVQGAANWWRDAVAVASGGPPRGVEAFRPGVGVALTPGRVVHRNPLVELIQYEASTRHVQREPVLIVPSWILKYYILDLTPDDSLVRFLVDRGHTVFMVSWRNPGSADRDLTMDDYLHWGVLDVIEAVHALCPHAGIHAAGYCLGGTLLAMGAALLGARHAHPLRSVSILAGQVDFEEPGELGLFMDESQVAFLEDLMAESGYLDGRRMAGAFQLINSKDLVWSKLLHEYLMGAQTPMTAMRAWNADATRMPARMHADYLRRLYLENEFAEGTYRVLGEQLDLRAVRVPLFVLGTERDHVSPWRSVFKVLRLVEAPGRFVLASGGHNVGIVSPPAGPAAHPEAGYRWADHGTETPPADPQAWLSAARQEAGSWWPNWEDWLRAHGSGTMAARPLPARRFDGAYVPAPGTHVFEQ